MEYRKKNKDRINSNQRKHREALESKHENRKQAAKQRNIERNLSYEEWLWTYLIG